MARTVAAGSGSLFAPAVWCTVSACTGKYSGGHTSVPSDAKRSDSSAPHAARLSARGAPPGPRPARGGGVRTGGGVPGGGGARPPGGGGARRHAEAGRRRDDRASAGQSLSSPRPMVMSVPLLIGPAVAVPLDNTGTVGIAVVVLTQPQPVH